jgi:transposase
MTKRSKVKFKVYAPNQGYVFPPTVEDFVPENHPVRVVNQVIERINIDQLISSYKGGGSSSYHPRMLLKVMVYAYLSNIYSSRKIEEALMQNVFFMWLSGMNKPDHNTINRFRSERLKDVLKSVFCQIVILLAEQGVLSLKDVYLDGTKIEANANKYTFVWGGAIKASKERIRQQLDELWAYAQRIASEEMNDTEPLSYDQIDAEKVKHTIEQIDQALKGKDIDPKKRQKLNYAKKNWPKNLEKYDQQREVMGERKNFSKTDNDATFMRMKEDHMKNGQLKPGYNLQISTNKQFIVNYSVHQTSNDFNTLQSHIGEFIEQYHETPRAVIADAGYGSLENYEFLEQNHIEAYVKFPYFDKEQTKAYSEDPFLANNLFYNEQKDCFYCPMGQCMTNVGKRERITDNGYEQEITIYQAQNCNRCPLRGSCHKQMGNRRIQINQDLRRHKQKARESLLSNEGVRHRKQRPHDTEPVFGNIKYNKKFKRFNLRGTQKVKIEAGLLAIAHNLKKVA